MIMPEHDGRSKRFILRKRGDVALLVFGRARIPGGHLSSAHRLLFCLCDHFMYTYVQHLSTPSFLFASACCLVCILSDFCISVRFRARVGGKGKPLLAGADAPSFSFSWSLLGSPHFDSCLSLFFFSWRH